MKSNRVRNSGEKLHTTRQSESSRTRSQSRPASSDQQPRASSSAVLKRAEKSSKATSRNPEARLSLEKQSVLSSSTKEAGTNAESNVIDRNQSTSAMQRRQQESSVTPNAPASSSSGQSRATGKPVLRSKKGRQQMFGERSRDQSQEESSSSSQEMTTTSASSIPTDVTLTPARGGNIVLEQETSLDNAFEGPDCTDDDECLTLLESPRAERNQRVFGKKQMHRTNESSDLERVRVREISGSCQQENPTDIALYHDDDEINFEESQRLAPIKFRAQQARQLSAEHDYELAATINEDNDDDDDDDEDDNDELSNGAALTMADDDQITTVHSEEISFVVYPLGCCDFDETQLVSGTSTRAIQKCILRLSNKASREEAHCWGLDQSQPILMRLLEDHIQFTDIGSQTLLSSQPIQTIKSWAVDDDNNFAFVVEETPQAHSSGHSSVDYALLNGPALVCYVFRSFDDDDMSCKVAAKLNAEITRYREQLASRVSKSSRLKQMIVVEPHRAVGLNEAAADELAATDLDAEELDELDQLAAAKELTMSVKYIGRVQVPRPTGIDVLNVAIDTCLAEASNQSILHESAGAKSGEQPASGAASGDARASKLESPLIDAKLHVSASNVIVENVHTGSILVECRIRFLTFMGISRRDIRWCGFIMQNTTNKTFVAHCFECQPTAGPVCEAIQASCSRMYEKIVRGQRTKRQQQEDATSSIMPNGSKIRDTLAKTLSKIKLTPII